MAQRNKLTFYIVGNVRETWDVFERSIHNDWDYRYNDDTNPKFIDDSIILFSVQKLARVGEMIVINEDGTFYKHMTWLKDYRRKW